MTTQTKQDAAYLELMLSPMRRCATYMPAFGKGADEKVTLAEFKAMYGADPLYQWVGLDSDLMYAAHAGDGGPMCDHGAVLLRIAGRRPRATLYARPSRG